MILFFVSFLLVFLTSYLITSLITPKKSVLGLIYLFLVAFAEIVLTFEILSLFSSIKTYYVLGLNGIFFIVSTYLWLKFSKPIWALDLNNFKNRFINSIKLDKSLLILFIGFCVFVISAVILCTFMPITSADGQTYHVARSAFWVTQGSLNHFDSPDIRMLCLPINSEILYSWILLFIKKDVFLGFFSFVGYLLAIISIFNIMGYVGYCYRKRLWVIFILSSFSSVLVQVSGTETDIILAGLITSSIFLFWNALKTNNKIPLYMASLAYALAIGTKTPALIMIPGVGLFMVGLSIYFKQFKSFALFLFFGVLNFIIFSSYNYVLNYIQFSNFFGSENFMLVSKNYYGIKGLFASVIKYWFMFFDFTGFRWGDYWGPRIANDRDLILGLVGLNFVKDGIFTTPLLVNRTLLEPILGAGILGFLVFLPNLLWSLIRPIFKPRYKKTFFLFGFALLFIANVLTISYILTYMSFNVRFIMTYMVLSSPILVYSYLSNKNIIKHVLILFSLFYLMCVSTHLWARPVVPLFKMFFEHKPLWYIREISDCGNLSDISECRNSLCILRKSIKKHYAKNNKFLAFISAADYIYLLKALEFDGYKIDFKTLEDADNIDFTKYNVVFAPRSTQISTIVKDFDKRKDDYKMNKNNMVIFKKAPVPCFYVKNQNIPNYEQTLPYQVRCFMTDSFIKSKHLEFAGAAGIVQNTKMTSKDYYIIYENTLNPPLLKD